MKYLMSFFLMLAATGAGAESAGAVIRERPDRMPVPVSGYCPDGMHKAFDELTNGYSCFANRPVTGPSVHSLEKFGRADRANLVKAAAVLAGMGGVPKEPKEKVESPLFTNPPYCDTVPPPHGHDRPQPPSELFRLPPSVIPQPGMKS